MWLQSSSNGKKWKNAYRLVLGASGGVAKTVSAKKKSTTYYRWSVPETAAHFAGVSSNFKVIVK